MIPTRYELCDGLDLRCCMTCARNLDNNPGVHVQRTIKPAANPPRCADWKSMPVRALDSTHGRL